MEAFGFLAPLNFSFTFFYLLSVFEGVCANGCVSWHTFEGQRMP